MMQKLGFFLNIVKQKHFRAALFAASVLTMSISSVLLGRVSGNLVDAALQNNHITNREIFTILGMAFVYIVAATLSASSRVNLTEYLNISIYQTVKDKIRNLASSNYQEISVSKIVTVLSQNLRTFSSCLERILGRLLPDVLKWVAALCMLCAIAYELLAVSIITSALTGCYIFYMSKKVYALGEKYQEAMQELNRQDISALAKIEKIKAWNKAACYIEQSQNRIKTVLNRTKKLAFCETSISLPMTASAFLIKLSIIVCAGLLCDTEIISIGEATTVVLISDSVCNPVLAFDNSIKAIRRAQAAANQLFVILKQDETAFEPGSIRLTNDKGHAYGVYLKNVSFSYTDGIDIINNLTCAFYPGKINYILGANGSGKSTLIHLISGVFYPTAGEITVNDPDHNEDFSKSQVSVCPQDTCLFDVSIRDNICAGLPYDKCKMEQIAVALDIHDEILQTENGYDTVLKENGAPLSLGQRQRISLCRTIYRGNNIMIFDEPTSALDKHHKALVYSYLNTLAVEKIILVITHDLIDLSKGNVLKMG